MSENAFIAEKLKQAGNEAESLAKILDPLLAEVTNFSNNTKNFSEHHRTIVFFRHLIGNSIGELRFLKETNSDIKNAILTYGNCIGYLETLAKREQGLVNVGVIFDNRIPNYACFISIFTRSEIERIINPTQLAKLIYHFN